MPNIMNRFYRLFAETVFFGELAVKGYDTEPGKDGIDVFSSANSLGSALICSYNKKERKLFIPKSEPTTPEYIKDMREDVKEVAKRYPIEVIEGKNKGE